MIADETRRRLLAMADYIDSREHAAGRAMKLIYIAGPYSADSRVLIARNVQIAREAAAMVAQAGAFPVTPHLLGAGLEDAANADFWYAGTLELCRRCDALFATANWDLSYGTRLEIDEMRKLNKPVFFNSPSHLRAWLDQQLTKE